MFFHAEIEKNIFIHRGGSILWMPHFKAIIGMFKHLNFYCIRIGAFAACVLKSHLSYFTSKLSLTKLFNNRFYKSKCSKTDKCDLVGCKLFNQSLINIFVLF